MALAVAGVAASAGQARASTATLAPTADCTLMSYADTSSYCAHSELQAGLWVAEATQWAHTVLRFDALAALPAHTVVRSATLNLHRTDGRGTELDLSAYALTTAWTDAATWSSPDGTAIWDGGDYDPANYLDTQTVGPADGWYAWDMTNAVASWLDGTRPQDGVLIADHDDNEADLGDGWFPYFDSSESPSTSWRPYLAVDYEVDNSAPTWPGLAADASADYDPDTSSVDLNWNFASDPDLADGGPGSGVSGYNYRYKRAAGAWSAWTTTQSPWVDLPSSYVGETIDLEIQAYDAFGNTSPTVSASLEAEESTATPDNIETAPDDPNETGDPGELSDDDEPADMIDGNGDAAPPSGGGEALARSDYHETLCQGGGPCGSYDGNAAASYALHHYKIDSWHARDTRWSFYGGQGGDCTNFASEALYAGGMRFMGAEGSNSPDASDPADVFHFHRFVAGAWFSFYTQYLPGDQRYYPTASFVRSNDLFHHLLDYALAEVVPAATGHVHRGDLVFQREGDGPYHHTQVVVRVAGHKIYVAQHSKPEYHSIDWLVKHHLNRPGHIRNVDYFLVILHPTHAKANI